MKGRCQCGDIAFETPVEKPLELYVCHCTECQYQSSSLFGLTAIFPAFTIREPKPGALTVYRRRTLSGRDLDCYFCSRCGSRLMHKAEGEQFLSVKGGTLGRGIDWSKATHIWCKEAISDIPGGVKRCEEEPPSGGLQGGDYGK